MNLIDFGDFLHKKKNYIGIWMILTAVPGSIAAVIWRGTDRGIVFSLIEIAIVFFFSYLAGLGMWAFTADTRKRSEELKRQEESGSDL